jgi:transposase
VPVKKDAETDLFPPTVLGGILWVASTGSSWWEIPEEFGKWETAYRRYRLWIE